MTVVVGLVFAGVYLGLMLGRLPGLRLDRAGIVLLGTIALLATGAVDERQAISAVDIPTIALLFGLMVLSAQLRVGGFYARTTQVLAAVIMPPWAFLGICLLAMGALSAIFSNDIICLAAAPVLISICRKRRLNPVPFLLGLACAANIGSAATLIGNPQNILIGQVKGLSFWIYLRQAGPVALLCLLVCWGVIVAQYRGRWSLPGQGQENAGLAENTVPPFNPWETTKGLLVALILFLFFLAGSWPRDLVALAGAGLLLTSRKLYSREMLGLVDWQLLVMFVGLFIINDAVQQSGLPAQLVAEMADLGVDLTRPGWLTLVVALLSNAVSNVPAVMLLLPLVKGAMAGPVMAVTSTLAGNLLVVGSIANIIVIEGAKQNGVIIDWRCHFKTGLPVTFFTLLISFLYFSYGP